MIDAPPAFLIVPGAVLGLGASGRAAARALLRGRPTVWAWDDSEQPRSAPMRAGIPLVDLAATGLERIGGAGSSPGIPHTYPEPHPVAARARAAGVRIIGDVELLFRAHPDGRYVGITGTNGKVDHHRLDRPHLRCRRYRCAGGRQPGSAGAGVRAARTQGLFVFWRCRHISWS